MLFSILSWIPTSKKRACTNLLGLLSYRVKFRGYIDTVPKITGVLHNGGSNHMVLPI